MSNRFDISPQSAIIGRMALERTTLLWPGTGEMLASLLAILISFKILEYLAKKIGLVKEK
jgi:hypothetical protein